MIPRGALVTCQPRQFKIGWIKLYCSFIFVLFHSIVSISLLAQTAIRFERITVEDGLSQSAITSMVQDKYGYLWIGTLDGLNRYDGNSFAVYRDSKKSESSLSAHSINNLFLDANENLWVSHRNGLSVYEPDFDKFRNYNTQIDDRNVYVRDLDHMADSLVVLSTNVGILDFNPQTGKVGESKLYSRFKNENVRELVVTKNKTTWVFTERCVSKKVWGSDQWTEFFRDETQLKATYFEKFDEIYVRAGNQLLKYDWVKDRFLAIAVLPKDQWSNFSGMLKTSTGTLWVAHGGISVFDSNDKLTNTLFHIPQDPNSLSGPFVSAIYETRDGVVWVGTNGLGLNKYNPSRSIFGYLGTFPGAPLTLSNNYINSLYTEDDTSILVSTLGGLSIIDLKNSSSRHFLVKGRDATEGRIFKIFDDTRGNKWLATNRGLMLFRGNEIRGTGNSQLDRPDLNVYDAVSINESEILLATDKGILNWDQAKNEVSAIHSDGSLVISKIGNAIWFESGEQLKIMRWSDKKIIKSFPKNGSDSLNAPLASIKCIFRDSDHNVWIGTDGGGLSYYDSLTQNFRHFGEFDGLVNNVVYGILEDEAGNLWMSTNEGLSVFDRKRGKFIRTFNKTDGLQGNEFNTRAYFRSPSGTMYFGGVNGLSFFDPGQALKIPSVTPTTVLTGFYINNVKQIDLEDAQIGKLYKEHEIQLDWTQRNVGFDIAGLGFTFPSGVQYQYKLEGFDKDWNLIGNQSRITFTNLPAGDFILHVKSGNSFGDWEHEGLTIGIAVISPVWMSPWFIAGVVSFVVLSIIFFNSQRTLFLKRRAALLQSLVEDRTREIQTQKEEIAAQNEELTAQAEALENSNIELENRVAGRTQTLQRLNKELVDQNTQLEQFTFITAHNIRGPIARIRGLVNLLSPERDREVVHHLETSINALDEVISDLNSVLSIANSTNKNFEIVSLRPQLLLVLETLSQEITATGALIDISEFGDVKVLGLKAYFQSIFYNLIHNALKYSDRQRKTTIKCYAQTTESNVRIKIEDNGIGIDMRYARDKIFKLHQRFHPNIAGKGYGLFLVKTQVKVMGGKIFVESELDQGTTFTVEFPIPSDAD